MTATSTEIFYNLISLNDTEKLNLIESIRYDSPTLYEEVIRLIDVEKNSLKNLTHLFAKNAHDMLDSQSFVGEKIGKYIIKKRIGEGGMGVVYAALRCDNTYQQELAVKFFRPSLLEIFGRDLLFLEAQLLASINHPYVAKVFDAGEYQSHVFIVMERVNGDNLAVYKRTHKADLSTLLNLFIKICEAIEHSHQNQVLHADIKPENIIIDENGNPKVIDFNITQKLCTKETQNTLLALSKGFASPEQANAEHLTHQSDIYSLGKLLKFLLEGFRFSADLTQIIEKATRHNPKERYGVVFELRSDIANFQEKRPISNKKNRPLYVTQRLVQRHPISAVLFTLFIFSLFSFTVVIVDKNYKLTQEKELTEDMMLELTNLVFYGKNVEHKKSFDSILDLTRKRVIANQSLPAELKQKMLLSMLQPLPKKQKIEVECQDDC